MRINLQKTSGLFYCHISKVLFLGCNIVPADGMTRREVFDEGVEGTLGELGVELSIDGTAGAGSRPVLARKRSTRCSCRLPRAVT